MIKCFKENNQPSTAFVHIAKATTIPDDSLTMVKGRITNLRSIAKTDDTHFLLEASPIRDQVVSFHVKMDTPTNTVNFPINNGTGSDFMLKSGERLANIKFIENV